MLDNALVFALKNDADITVTADLGDINFGNSDIGAGEPLYWNTTVEVTGTSGAEAQLRLRTAATTAGLAAGDIILQSPAYEYITLIAGMLMYSAPLPTGKVLGRVRAQVVVTNGAGTALRIRSWIGSAPQTGMGIRTPIAASA